MRIDLEKLKKLEQEYKYDNPVCLNLLENCIKLYISYTINTDINPTVVETLNKLGILVDDDKNNKQIK